MKYFPYPAFLCLPSCIVLPLPHTSPAGPDYHGRVYDQVTGDPVGSAVVEIVGGKQSTKTGKDGLFALRNRRCFHLFYYANPSFSMGFPACKTSDFLVITHPGYEERIVDLSSYDMRSKNLARQTLYGSGDSHRSKRESHLNPVALVPEKK